MDDILEGCAKYGRMEWVLLSILVYTNMLMN